MLSRLIARSLMAIVPEKVSATVTLAPDSLSPVVVQVFNAWCKPVRVRLSRYGQLNMQGDETLINVPDHELNPASNEREIRARDQIDVRGATYRVLSTQLTAVRTVWECTCRKEIG